MMVQREGHTGFKACRHSWQYEGPIAGQGVNNTVIVRCCMNCGRRAEDAERWQTVSDYALCKSGTGPGDLQTYIENLRCECSFLKEALRKHGRHSLECPRHHDFPGECTCGLESALRSDGEQL